MPTITLPDGSKKVFEKSVTILEIAQSIGAGLAKATIAGKVNDVLLDATIPISKDSEVVIITSKDKEGIEIIRHSFAHLIGHAVKQIYSDIKMAIGPVIEDGFYYDIFSEYRFTPDDLIKIENRINIVIKTIFNYWPNRHFNIRVNLFNCMTNKVSKGMSYYFNSFFIF